MVDPDSGLILLDFGGVIVRYQRSEDVDELARIAGMKPAQFHQRYWLNRPQYDRADVSPEEYWSSVTGRALQNGIAFELTSLDDKSWLHRNPETLDRLQMMSTKGLRLAVLSNAPTSLARTIEGLSWLPALEQTFFSCDFHLSKPDPRIFEATLGALKPPPENITFVDDREDNIATAASLGMATIHFRSADQLDALT